MLTQATERLSAAELAFAKVTELESARVAGRRRRCGHPARLDVRGASPRRGDLPNAAVHPRAGAHDAGIAGLTGQPRCRRLPRVHAPAAGSRRSRLGSRSRAPRHASRLPGSALHPCPGHPRDRTTRDFPRTQAPPEAALPQFHAGLTVWRRRSTPPCRARAAHPPSPSWCSSRAQRPARVPCSPPAGPRDTAGARASLARPLCLPGSWFVSCLRPRERPPRSPRHVVPLGAPRWHAAARSHPASGMDAVSKLARQARSHRGIVCTSTRSPHRPAVFPHPTPSKPPAPHIVFLSGRQSALALPPAGSAFASPGASCLPPGLAPRRCPRLRCWSQQGSAQGPVRLGRILLCLPRCAPRAWVLRGPAPPPRSAPPAARPPFPVRCAAAPGSAGPPDGLPWVRGPSLRPCPSASAGSRSQLLRVSPARPWSTPRPGSAKSTATVLVLPALAPARLPRPGSRAVAVGTPRRRRQAHCGGHRTGAGRAGSSPA